MGYNTRFSGELTFTHAITVPQLARLNEMLGEDPSQHGWVPARDTDVGYIDLEITKAMDGLKWNGAEKTYYLEKSVNVVLEQMRKEWPEFGLKGELLAQGEDMEDRWKLVIGEDGRAQKVKIAITGKRVQCPECRHRFIIES